MKIAVLNDIHASTKRRSDRLLSEKALTLLPDTIRAIQRHQPDYVLVLGDLIQNVDQSHDGAMLDQVLKQFEPIKDICLVASGNHEGRGLGLDYLKETLKKHGFKTGLYGLVEQKDKAFLYLSSSETRETGSRYDFLPSEQVTWLDQTLESLQTPSILFSHHFLLESPHRYNFYIEVTGSNNSAIKNGDEVQAVLQKHVEKIKLLVCAHSHWLNYDQTQFLPVLGLPAYSENILSEIQIAAHLQAWSLIEWEATSIKVNCFSGERFSWAQVII